ncbi:class I SAM-dependent methyltransferase [Deferribacter thermophilus]|uniref:O-methyltransferase n=1 Tax=Deferribacter thermophilus TaxID=53573 RepID=UPI003C1E0D09
MKSSVMMTHVVNFLSRFSSDEFDEIKTYSTEKMIPAVEKCVAEFLKFMVKLRKPNKILEIGTGAGYATAHLALYGKEVTTVEYNPERLEKAKDFLKDFDNITFVGENAKEYLKKCNDKFDFVFIDGVKRDYLEYFFLLKPHLNDGALLIFDDVLFYGMVLDEDCEIPFKYRKTVEMLKEFIFEMTTKYKDNCNILPIGNGLLLLNYEY